MFYERQLDVYAELCGKVGNLAKTPKPSEKDIRELDELIINKVWPIADREVVEAAINYMRALKLEAGIGEAVAGVRLDALDSRRKSPHEKVI